MVTTSKTNVEMAYSPLSEVRNSLRVKWYRSPINHDLLRELSIRTNTQGWKQAGGHVTLYLSLLTLTIVLWAQQSWLALMVSLWLTGFVATFFKGTAAHELGHGTVFKTKQLNTFFLYFVSLISWWDPFDYAASHTYHHRYTTHRDADRENVLPLTPSLHPWLIFQLLTISLFLKPGNNFSKGGFLWTIYLTTRTALGKPSGHVDIPSQEWLKSLHEDQPDSFRQSVRWSQVLLTFHLAIFAVSMLSGWWILSIVITMPSYIANIGSYLLGTTQHCGLKQSHNDFRKNTRSIAIHPFLSFLYWHMNWHIEHHMYAGVPCYNLSALAKELQADMPKPRTLWQAWDEMRQIWRRQTIEPGYEYDTPSPDSHECIFRPPEDDLVTSIGDLEPKGANISN